MELFQIQPKNARWASIVKAKIYSPSQLTYIKFQILRYEFYSIQVLLINR